MRPWRIGLRDPLQPERLLGTVSSALPAHAHCPTVVVPYRGGEDDAILTGPKPVRRIVVGVDGSPASEVALEHGSKTLMASRIVDAIVAFLRGGPQ